MRFANGAAGTISYLTTGNPRFPKETLDAAAGGCSARLDNFAGASVWTGRKRSSSKARGGQDKGQRAELAALHRGLPGRHRDAHPARFPDRHHEGHDRGRGEPGQRTAGAGMSTGAGISRVAGSRLGWYARRAARMSPAEVAWRARDQAMHLAWSRRQVRPGQVAGLPPLPPGDRRFTATLPPGTAGKVPAAARSAVLAAADQLLAGEWEVLGIPRTDLAEPDWFRDPVTGRRSPAGRYAFRINHRSEDGDRERQAGLGGVPAAPPDVAGHGMVPQP